MNLSWRRWMVGAICVGFLGATGCGSEREKERDRPDAGEEEEEGCAVDNGGCGDPAYYSCTDGVDKAPTCTALDLCATDNGGCGDPAYHSCTDGVGKEPTCTVLDLCATDNGGCGDPEEFLCTDGIGKAPTCVTTAICATDNGGCGDPAEYACIPTGEGERACRFVGECVLEELTIEAETAVTVSRSLGLVTDELFIERRGWTGSGNSSAADIFLRFDLRAVPESMQINEAALQMVSYKGYASGNDGNVYVHPIDSSWDVESLSWENRPQWLSDTPLGFWWAWYDNREYEAVRQVHTTALAEVVQEAAQGPKKVSFNLYSIGYATSYRTLEDEAEEKRPQLILRTSRCITTALTAKEHTMVSAESPDTPERSGLSVQGQDLQVYLKFDLSSLPADVKIVDTSLTMAAVDGESFDGDGRVFTSFVEDDSWDERELTWNTRPAEIEGYRGHWTLKYDSELPQEERLQHVRNDYAGLIPLVQREYEGDQELSLRLSSSGDLTRYDSRYAPREADRPRLLVTYEVP